MAVLAAGEPEFAGQGEQPIEPTALLYEPEAHGAHVVPATKGVNIAEPTT